MANSGGATISIDCPLMDLSGEVRERYRNLFWENEGEIREFRSQEGEISFPGPHLLGALQSIEKRALLRRPGFE